MAKQKTAGVLAFLIYCVPWAFGQMYCDRWLFSSVWELLLIYLLQLLILGSLAWYCGKTKRVALAVTGNIVSCGLSLLLAYQHPWEKLYPFAPLGVAGMVFFLFTYTLAVQMLIWRKQRGQKEAPLIVQFLEILAMLLVPTMIFIFAMLLLARIW